MEAQSGNQSSREKGSFIVCRNSKGLPVRGSLMHFTNQNAVFEVYNPFSILQLSEVLTEFKIVIGERMLYAGRGVVSSLMNTGIMLVCEATLVDAWNDVDVFSLIQNKDLFGGEVERFVSDWKHHNEIMPDFKVLTSDLQGFLSELSLWLKQIEVSVSRVAPRDFDTLSLDLVDRLAGPLRPTVEDFLGKLEVVARNVPPEQSRLHKAYIRRDVHPLTLCSPFVHRAFTKPLGYAGDFEMISMILERPYEGQTLFAKTINKLLLDTAPAEAHRNRIAVLKKLLDEEADRAKSQDQPLEVLNIGCGPAKEVRDFIAGSRRSDICRITLMDFSKEALSFAQQKAIEQRTRSSSQIKLEFVEKSIDELLREAISARRERGPNFKEYDLIYCAGLFDYFTDNVCRRLIELFYQWLGPQGLLCVTNIHPCNPQRQLMEYLLEWNVFYRTEADFEALGPPEGIKEVFVDGTGVNVFLKIRKAT